MHTELESWAPAAAAITRPWSAERPMPHIRALRVMTLAILAGLAVLGIVLLFSVDLGGSYPSGWLYGWLGIAALSLSIGFYTRSKSTERFVRSANERFAFSLYRSRMVIGLMLAEIPALAGFAICLATDSIIPYLLGLLVSLVKIYQTGPVAGDIRGLQKWIDEYQDPIDLGGILMKTPEVPIS